MFTVGRFAGSVEDVMFSCFHHWTFAFYWPDILFWLKISSVCRKKLSIKKKTFVLFQPTECNCFCFFGLNLQSR